MHQPKGRFLTHSKTYNITFYLKGKNVLVISESKMRTIPLTKFNLIERIILTDSAAHWGMFINLCKYFQKDYKEILRDAGWIIQRLCLPLTKRRYIKMSYRVLHDIGVALLLNPYLKEDCKKCPTYIRATLTNPGINAEWLRGLKISRHAFTKPTSLSFKVKNQRDYRWALAMHHLETGWQGEESTAALELLKRLQHRRVEYKVLPRQFYLQLTDAFRIANTLERVLGIHIPVRDNPIQFDQEAHAQWLIHFHRIQQREQINYREKILPGVDYIPHLEHERIKTGEELINAGEELRHCVGVYVSSNYIHYRRGDIVCQIDPLTHKILQCLDKYNQNTTESYEYMKEIQSFLDRKL